jgi:hypothetical protein
MVAWNAKGAEGTPFVLDVERGKVREFARAVQAHTLPEHVEGEHPVVPPTFLTVQMHWETFTEGANPWSKVEMSFERGMHAEQEYVFHGPPPRAGERLVARSRIDDVWSKESRSAGTLTFVRMITEFRDEDGTLRAEAILTGVETSAPPKEGA